MTPADRAALLRKYRILAAWRRLKDESAMNEGEGHGDTSGRRIDGDPGNQSATTRGELRALSQEFPGALRELDVLGLTEILRRIDCLSEQAGDEEASPHVPGRDEHDHDHDPWMTWIVAYHALMRAVLVIKRKAGRARHSSAASVAQALATIRTTSGLSLDESFVHAVIHPPAGRLGIVVLTALATHFQVPAMEISRTLFPPRRPPPYEL
ncbi:MAG: hypothetical protein H7X95_08280 [Deltaproteobacteria bacterium]|nr:hypothetical protein [Deltaproteobacteria bacterium]